MNLQTLGRAVRGGGLPQIAQLQRTYDSKTDQTDQRFDIASEFGTLVGPKLTRPAPKLTSGTAQRLHPSVVVGGPIDAAHARPSDGAQP
jgi:hypothetical protein